MSEDGEVLLLSWGMDFHSIVAGSNSKMTHGFLMNNFYYLFKFPGGISLLKL